MTKKGRPKLIFVTGGVVSALGKGIAASSIGTLLESRGLRVVPLKLDPYINVDAGTMNPFQHGEVFVTEDGSETDLDLGHYERFTHATLSASNNLTTGKVYGGVIAKERKGDYLGKTVQVVPHITTEIKENILRVVRESQAEVGIVELGGTIGDIEGLPFLEAIRQLRIDLGTENTVFVHVTLVPYIQTAGEVKTKPTQHTVGELRRIGIQPDILLCRTDHSLSRDVKSKIALFCNVPEGSVIEARDVATVYEVPLGFQAQRLDDILLRQLRLATRQRDLKAWARLVERIKHPAGEVTIGIVGKYVYLKDAYKSITEAFVHAGAANNARVNIRWLEAETIEDSGKDDLAGVHGVLVPGGFGDRGIEGKIEAIRYVRERQIPFLGICLGMQLATVEFGRSILNLRRANSTEFDPRTPHPVIDLMPDQKKVKDLGGTMRLGSYPCRVSRPSRAFHCYGKEVIFERHRHRYEFNNAYRDRFSRAGMRFSGVSPDGRLVEMVELPAHPWFVATQFHPEFQSRPRAAHPLFREFVRAALGRMRSKGNGQGSPRAPRSAAGRGPAKDPARRRARGGGS